MSKPTRILLEKFNDFLCTVSQSGLKENPCKRILEEVVLFKGSTSVCLFPKETDTVEKYVSYLSWLQNGIFQCLYACGAKWFS